ncbi:zincin [Hyaloscypha variabilis]
MATPRPPSVLTSSQIVPTMKTIISKFQAMQETIIRTVTPTTACFSNVFQPWADVSNEVQAQLGMISLLGYAAPSKETHEAVKEAKKLFNVAEAAWTARRDLFILVKAAADKCEELDRESRLWVKVRVQDFINAGHGLLDESVIERYLRVRSRIDGLREQFSRNLRTENGGLWIDEGDLDGVPELEIQRWKLGEAANEGKRFVPFANGELKTILAHAQKATTRERMYLADQAKVPENIDLFREVTCLRDSQARLLGFPSHGEFRIRNRAVKSITYAENFLKHLRGSLIPRGRDELLKLQRLRIEDLKSTGFSTDGDDGHFSPWDLEYYKRMMSLEKNSDEGKISQYFPLGPTVVGMLRIFESFLRLRFVLIPSNKLDANSIWHEDVFPNSTESTCALLKHSEVVTLFHELGHGIHDLVSRTKYSPARKLVLDEDILKELSCHYTTLDSRYLTELLKQNPSAPGPPEKIPDDLLDAIIGSRDRFLGSVVSIFDLKIHSPSSHEEIADLDFAKLWYDLRAEVEGIDFSRLRNEGHEHVTFGHLLSGYDMGYYGYLSATPLPKTFFSRPLQRIQGVKIYGDATDKGF